MRAISQTTRRSSDSGIDLYKFMVMAMSDVCTFIAPALVKKGVCLRKRKKEPNGLLEVF